MEGAVYAIDETRVAKRWFTGNVPGLRRIAAFYDALSGLGLSFAVPRIESIDVVDGQVVTVERRFPGQPLRPGAGRLGDEAQDREVQDQEAQDLIVALVAELAGLGPLPEARVLPVLGGDEPLARGGDFPQALARLAARRVTPVLGAAVGRLDALMAALPARLREVDTGVRSVIHGDLIPGNVLAGESGIAVLDWGFLTAEGDPAFDAAVTAAIFDMYGPRARATEEALLDRMPYDRTTLLVYRAAYSLITATAYDPRGRDGHFAWCAEALNRPEIVRAVLG
ncbi:phosphotransferase family protein [Actinoplanes sp. CA-030573]|uniref:phosphotransferase family protein n=1 Tax=Actinoplanes sp. CA-030573 TaxID=3239898 RepID=UPI003D91C4F8